jgi:Protein of unknown function (DUF3592)
MNPVSIAKGVTVSGLALCLGGYQLLRAWRNHVLARQSRTRASVSGQIAGSYLYGDFRRGYLPQVSYWYRVDGFRYSGSRITFGDDWQPTASFEALRYRYPFGATVTVYYDPKNPHYSALEPREVNFGWACFMGSVWLLSGIFLVSLMILDL